MNFRGTHSILPNNKEISQLSGTKESDKLTDKDSLQGQSDNLQHNLGLRALRIENLS